MRSVSGTLSEKWLKAAVIGSYWGAFEIILGSFFHNMRFPLSGTLLSFFAVMLMVAFARVWDERGLFWRAALIAALMKSISPSAIILGPMTGILLEGILMEGAVLLLGRGLAGYLVGGALAVSSALLHKVVTLLVLYGFDLVRLLVALYHYALRSLHIRKENLDPLLLVLLLTGLYWITGMVAAWTGYFVGGKEREKKMLHDAQPWQGEMPESFSIPEGKEYAVRRLFLHLFLLVGWLWLLRRAPLLLSSVLVLGYAAVTLRFYDRAIRHLKNPWFWGQMVLITLVASLVWKGIETGDYFSREGLVVGLRMNLRALVVMVAFSAISVEFRNPVIRILLFRKGFSGVYRATALAFSSFPWVMKSFPGPRRFLRRPLDVLAEALATAETLYERFAGMDRVEPQIYLVTSGIGTGKTTFLEKVVEMLRKEGVAVTGFLARAAGDDESKKYILYNLALEEERVLAEKKRGGRLRTGRYTFFPATFRWGEESVWRDVTAGQPRVVVVDEVGPLEMRGKGWASLLDRLVERKGIVQIWSVREKLVSAVPRAWDFTPRHIIDPVRDTPGELVKRILSELQKKDPFSKNGS